MNMKKELALFLSALLVLSLSSCGHRSAEDSEGSEVLAGGWSAGDAFPVSEMTEEETLHFQQAIGNLSKEENPSGLVYTPIACLGTQVVAGLNYFYLCSAAAEGAEDASLALVKVYVDLSQNASVLEIREVSSDALLDLFPAEESAPAEEGMLAGGWTVNENLQPVTLPDPVQEAFTAAVDGLNGVGYLPIAVAGRQVVAGMNYLIICRQTVLSNPPASSICVVKLYVPVSGDTPSIMDTAVWNYWE